MSVAISIKVKNLDKIKAKFKIAPVKMTIELGKAINRIITKIENDAKRNAPVNKQSGGGNLRQSIRSIMLGPARGKVEVGANYGIYVHEGTRPHIIRVRQKKVLANKREGRIFGKVVHHPGTKKNPFLQKAVDENKSFINKEFSKAVKQTFK